MVFTTKELIKNGETEYSIRKKVKEKKLFLMERGVYCTNKYCFRNDDFIAKKYPNAIITGFTAFFLYDLTDFIPDEYDLATKQHSAPIRQKDVKQSYQDPSIFEIGVTTKETNDGVVRIYDLERLLIELVRLRKKYSAELYYEVLDSFRRIKEEIDFYKLHMYLKNFKNGRSILLKIKEII